MSEHPPPPPLPDIQYNKLQYLGVVSLKCSFWCHVFDDVSNKSVHFTFLSKEIKWNQNI